MTERPEIKNPHLEPAKLGRFPRAFVALFLACAAIACSRVEGVPEQVVVDRFGERALELGVDFVHDNGMIGERHFAEILGPGCGMADLDGDGDLDLVLVQGGALPGSARDESLGDRVYRNQLIETGRLGFIDLTDSSGLRSTGYGMGVAAGDYDNDGLVDLYISNLGSNQLWHNLGDWRFEDVTAVAGVDDPRWSTSASWVDLDRDGWLDLYVAAYVDYAVEDNRSCVDQIGRPEYCGPNSYGPLSDRLFRNLGNGRFEDTTLAQGLAKISGPGLGVIAIDADLDGWLDLYVANDGAANFLWMNHEGTLAEEALLRGAAVDQRGQALASMGVAAGDLDGDGDEELVMTHLLRELNTLYDNDDGFFSDRSLDWGLAEPSMERTGFGAFFSDLDRDGDLDLVIANGEVRVLPKLRAAGDPFPLDQANQILIQEKGRFDDRTAELAPALLGAHVSRGLAVGDLDNDGDPDLLIGNAAGPARLFVNQLEEEAHWLGVRLIDTNGRDSLGARAGLELEGGELIWRRCRSDGSFLSSNDPRILFGLGQKSSVESLLVEWLDGTTERFEIDGIDRYLDIVEGSGRPPG